MRIRNGALITEAAVKRARERKADEAAAVEGNSVEPQPLNGTISSDSLFGKMLAQLEEQGAIEAIKADAQAAAPTNDDFIKTNLTGDVVDLNDLFNATTMAVGEEDGAAPTSDENDFYFVQQYQQFADGSKQKVLSPVEGSLPKGSEVIDYSDGVPVIASHTGDFGVFNIGDRQFYTNDRGETFEDYGQFGAYVPPEELEKIRADAGVKVTHNAALDKAKAFADILSKYSPDLKDPLPQPVGKPVDLGITYQKPADDWGTITTMAVGEEDGGITPPAQPIEPAPVPAPPTPVKDPIKAIDNQTQYYQNLIDESIRKNAASLGELDIGKFIPINPATSLPGSAPAAPLPTDQAPAEQKYSGYSVNTILPTLTTVKPLSSLGWETPLDADGNPMTGWGFADGGEVSLADFLQRNKYGI